MDFTRCLFSSSDVTGCGYVRSFLPARYLNGNFMGGLSNNTPLEKIDHIFLQRHSHEGLKGYIKSVQAQGKKIWYDIDDDFWTIEDSNPAKKSYTPEILNNISSLITLCNGVFCSTEHLKNKLTHLNSCVNVIPNLVPIPHYPKEVKKKIRIGYAGSPSHVGDFSPELISALKKLHDKYEDKIEYVFVGYVPPEIKPLVHFIKGVDAPNYLNLLNHINYDIFLIPLADNEFNRSKSNLKWLDAGITTCCPVVSKVPCYNDLEHEVTGIFIENEEWFERLESLINNISFAQTIATQAFDHIKENFSWEYAFRKQIDVYTEVLKEN